jgi:hypothetical protein
VPLRRKLIYRNGEVELWKTPRLAGWEKSVIRASRDLSIPGCAPRYEPHDCDGASADVLRERLRGWRRSATVLMIRRESDNGYGQSARQPICGVNRAS